MWLQRAYAQALESEVEDLKTLVTALVEALDEAGIELTADLEARVEPLVGKLSA
jgi:hypothetical protein